MPDGFNDHFTPSDRREIIETGLNLKNLAREFVQLKDAIAETHKTLKNDGDLLEERVRTLENFRWWIVGGAGAAGLIGSFMGRFIHP